MPTNTVGMDLRRLKDLCRDDLLDLWKPLYGREPPASISKPLLIYSIAYRMQENTLGSLKPATRRLLAQFLTTKHQAAPSTTLGAGTRLLREWHGTVHEVIIAEHGVLFNGREYRSLTEVAKIITGAHWSGPAFFGLKKPKRRRYEKDPALCDLHP